MSKPTSDISNVTSSKRKSADKSASRLLNIDALDQSLWLVKVPQFVAERWATAQNDEILGSLNISLKAAGNGRPPTKQLNIALDPTEHSTGPDSFTLEEQKSADSFVAFSSEKDIGKGFIMDGKVTKSMVLKPQINSEYRELIRQRGLNTVANRKEIGVANMQEIERTSTQSHTIEFITSDRMELKRKAAAERGLFGSKQSRMAGGGDADAADEQVMTALRSRVFEAFEKSERLTFKDILGYCTDVPGFSSEKDLRDLLEVYCRYYHRGNFKHFWELKPEFKDHSVNDPPAA